MAFRLPMAQSTALLKSRSRPRRTFPLANPNTSQQGLTLLECLMAIVVVAVTVATITPPIFLATATRVQARRGEQANQIAQGEIDRIRQLVERGTFTIAQLPTDAGNSAARDVGAATAVNTNLLVSPAACNTYPPTTPAPADSLVPVDVDGDCQPEFAMQVYRSNSCIPSSITATATTPPYGFQIGVRVYTYRPGETLPTLSTERASLGLAAGRRDNGSVRRPMQVLYSRAARVNSNESLECSGGGV